MENRRIILKRTPPQYQTVSDSVVDVRSNISRTERRPLQRVKTDQPLRSVPSTILEHANKKEREELLKSLPRFAPVSRFPEKANLEALQDAKPTPVENLRDNFDAIEGKIHGVEDPFQRLVNGMVILSDTPELNTTQVEIEDDDEAIPAQLMLESSDSDSEPPGSDIDGSDYPDSDDETVRETNLMDSVDPNYKASQKSQQSINNRVLINIDFASPNSQVQKEVVRVSRVLVKWGLDYSTEEIGIYSFHLVQKLMNDVEFPDSLRDILEDILDTIGVKALGYD